MNTTKKEMIELLVQNQLVSTEYDFSQITKRQLAKIMKCPISESDHVIRMNFESACIISKRKQTSITKLINYIGNDMGKPKLKQIQSKTLGRLSAVYEYNDGNQLYIVYKTKKGWTKIQTENPEANTKQDFFQRLSDVC